MPAALDVGLAGATLTVAGSVLAVGPKRVAGSPRSLSEILPENDAGFPGADLLRASAAGGSDPVLYYAWRDVLPPQPKHPAGEDAPAGRDTEGLDAAFWYADLVAFQPGVLPDGQPFRSTGHWNTASQLEAFQVLTGRVAMLIAGTSPGGVPYLTAEACGPGAITVVPPGAWHVTYCLDGPAAVFNIYTDLPAAACGRPTSRQGALDPALKYHRRPGPEATIRLDASGGIRLDAAGHQLPAPAFTPPAWLSTVTPPGCSLASLYLRPPSLTIMLDAAGEALAADWPAASASPGPPHQEPARPS